MTCILCINYIIFVIIIQKCICYYIFWRLRSSWCLVRVHFLFTGTCIHSALVWRKEQMISLDLLL